MTATPESFARFRAIMALVLFGGLIGAPAAQDRAAGIVTIDGRDWSLETSEPMPWAEASEFCETLESNGRSDWRLATQGELEELHASMERLSISSPFDFEGCCAWSSDNLATLPAERKGQLPAQSGEPEVYYWGLLFDGGVSYYSNGRFDDGFALCTRDP
jgi:hypothetical protein